MQATELSAVPASRGETAQEGAVGMSQHRVCCCGVAPGPCPLFRTGQDLGSRTVICPGIDPGPIQGGQLSCPNLEWLVEPFNRVMPYHPIETDDGDLGTWDNQIPLGLPTMPDQPPCWNNLNMTLSIAHLECAFYPPPTSVPVWHLQLSLLFMCTLQFGTPVTCGATFHYTRGIGNGSASSMNGIYVGVAAGAAGAGCVMTTPFPFDQLCTVTL